jgi:hypothetical protein
MSKPRHDKLYDTEIDKQRRDRNESAMRWTTHVAASSFGLQVSFFES